MSEEDRRPVIFLAFANDRDDHARYLRNLAEEVRRVRERLDESGTEHLCEVVVHTNTTVGELLDVFQDPRYRDRIAVFHFGGHAGGYQLLMESAEGRPEFAHAEGLADFLGHQRGLQLVFLNGCSTQPQVEGLLQSGVPAVIATSESIDDSVATELSARYYAAIAGGVTIATAYTEAAAAVKTVKGGRTRDLYRADEAPADRWPWDLYVREGADIVREWSLPKAAGDPLFGLPPLPEKDLPETPYRHLQWFREEDAELFFGRGREIRAFYELVTSPSAAPILLFYGQSGVGKSSMLAAGLLPRLASSCQVRYARRQRDLGLAETLAAALRANGPDASVAGAWHAVESKADQPFVVILDQVEEAFTSPRPDDPDELGRFVRVLSETFADPPRRPRGKLVLAFRKEWLADIDARLVGEKLFRSRYYVERLDRAGIVEIVEGPARCDRLRTHFRLAVEQGLAGLIADDLLEDRDAAVAPTLEVLLTKMWKQAAAQNADAPAFTTALYQELRRKGLLLDDFVDEQLRALRAWNANAVDTGLALDVLAFHTTSLGTAESRTRPEIEATYPHQSAVLPGLLQRNKDLYLLVDHVPPAEKEGDRAEGTRLAHDTLAPLVRRRFKDSDTPGQRARRILENRGEEWRDGKPGSPLDQADLATVERGEAGMPAWSADERRLIQASRRRRRITRATTWGAFATIAVACLVAGYFGLQAQQQAARVRDATIATSAAAQEDPLVAALMIGSLAGHPEPPRGAEIAAGLVETPVPVALLASGGVLSAAFSPDGRRVVTVSMDDTVRVWNVDGSGPAVVAGHGGRLRHAAFSRDGRRVLSVSDEGVVQVWNADGSGRKVLLGPPGAGAMRPYFSSDGQRVVTVSVDSLQVWNADGSGTPVVLRRHRVPLAFSADGRRVVTTSDDKRVVRVLNADGSGTPVVLGQRGGGVISVAFSPDGRHVATASDDDTLRVWDVGVSGTPVVQTPTDRPLKIDEFSPDGRLIAARGLGDDTVQMWEADMSARPVGLKGGKVLAFSPDGRLVVTASRNTALVWHAAGGGRPVVLAGHAGPVESAAFRADGRRVITVSADYTARVWNINGSDTPVMMAGQGGTLSSAPFSLDRPRVITVSADDTVRVWNADGSGRLLVLAGEVAAVSRDGQRVVTVSADTVRVWKADGSGRPAVLAGEVAAVRPDGQRVATVSADTVRVWNADGSGTPVVLGSYSGGLSSAAFSPDGQLVVTTSDDDTTIVWSARGSGRPVLLGGGEVGAAFSPNGRRVLAVSTDAVRVWNVDGSGTPVVLGPHTGSVTSAAFSADGGRVVTASDDGTARVWNADGSGRPVVLAGPSSSLDSAAFSPDGQRVVTVSEDGTARVWRADGSGGPVVLSGHGDSVESAAFSPDSRRVVTLLKGGTAQVWPVTWEALAQFLRSATSACLTQEQRERLLAETEREARAKYDACERQHGRPGTAQAIR